MNLDDLQTQVSEATKRLSQRFAQEESERPPKKPPTIEGVVTSLEPGPIIREVSPGGANVSSTGQQPPPPPPPDGGTHHYETVAGAVDGVAATIVVDTDGTGWTFL